MRKNLLASMIALFMISGISWAQERTVSGKVTSTEDGSSLPGVNVVLKGTTNGTVTDADGNFTLTGIPASGGSLIFSFIGLTTEEIPIGDRTVVDVSLALDVTQLSEVVVTALGLEVQKDKVGSASSNIGGNALVKSGETGLLNSMAGKAAGINITSATGDPGAGSRIVIRGATSITGSLQPLIILDGIPISNDYTTDAASGSTAGVAQQSRLNDINPADIESIEVLKGASAAALWGARAANGVLMITTKKGKGQDGRWTVDFTSRYSVDELNKSMELQDGYGQGSRGIYGGVFYSGSTPNTAYGDRIADRTGGADAGITDPLAAGYNGYFETADGRRFYAVPAGTSLNPHGGKNDNKVYDRYDPLFNNGNSWYNSIGIGTSSKNGNIYLSVSSLDQKGILIKNSDYNRNTVRLNATQIVDKFTFTTNVGYTKTKADRVQQGSNISGLFLGALRTPADFDMTAYVGTYYAPDGSVNTGRQRAYRNHLGQRYPGSSYDNPLWLMENISNTSDVDRINGKIELGYDPLSWLNVTGRIGIDTYTDERNEFFPEQASTNVGGLYSKETLRSNWFQADIFARAKFTLTDNIGGTALVGVGWSDRSSSNVGGISTNFINISSPPNLANAPADAQSAFGSESQTRNLGYYSTVSLDFYDQLFVNLTGRYDLWSTFPENDNSFFYPAADVAWQFSKLLPQSEIFSFGKLRAGYGTVGRAPGPYVTNTYFTQSTYTEGWGPTIDGGLYGGAFRRSSQAGNPNIKPETKTEFEIGTDLRFWNNRVNFSATYYSNVTKDLIVPVDAPNASGFSSSVKNGATIENKGFEIELGGDVIKNDDFTWNLALNWARNRNEVTEIAGGVMEIGLNGFTGSASSAVVGEQLGVIWGNSFDRDAQGNYILNSRGFPTQKSTPNVLGDPNPDWRGGVMNTFSYKRFSLSVLVERFHGGDIWNGTRGALTTLGMAGPTGVTSTISAADAATLINSAGLTVAAQYPGYANTDGSYTVRGEVKDFGGGPVFVDERWWSTLGGGFGGPAEQFVEDASWTRIREVTLLYNLPTGGFLSKAGIRNASISATGRNLVLWTNYSGIDPDTNLTGASNGLGLDYFQNPSTRSYQFTLNLTF